MEDHKAHDKNYCVGPICYHGDHGKHVLLRWALGIAILLIALWMGVKIGELRATIGGYGYGFGYGMHNKCFGNSFPMMQNLDQEYPYQFWMR
jgi:hypothetical protein